MSDWYLNNIYQRVFVITVYYNDVITGEIASQITSLPIVYSTVYSSADHRKHYSSASLAFVWGIHRWPVNSPHKWPVTRKMFPFDDVIMKSIIWSFMIEGICDPTLCWACHYLFMQVAPGKDETGPRLSMAFFVSSLHFYWISNHIRSKVWNEIIHPFPNLNGETIEVWEWISSFISHLIMGVITHFCWD